MVTTDSSCRPHKRSPADVKELAQHLSEFPCFMRGMHLAGIEALCRRMDFLQVPAMGVVLRQGDVGDSMFMVYKGTCQIYSCYGSTVSQAGAAFSPCGRMCNQPQFPRRNLTASTVPLQKLKRTIGVPILAQSVKVELLGSIPSSALTANTRTPPRQGRQGRSSCALIEQLFGTLQTRAGGEDQISQLRLLQR